MWIKALRLREVGKFANGYAIEGLTPGLNVLSGPNEHGKSTLLRALRILFEFPHTSNHGSVRALRPYSGGAPQIECEFSCAGQDWYLKKQYLTSRSAELRCDSDGRLYRGGDVDGALNAFVEAAAGSLATLKSQWVPQGDGFRPPRVADETMTTIQKLVADEVSAATGGDQLDMIVGKVADQLATLITPKSKRPRSGGPLHDAQNALQSISRVCEELREKEKASAQRLARFDEIAAIVSNADAVDQLESLKRELVERGKAIEAARERLAQCELATERRKRQTAELEAAEAALASFVEQIRICDARRDRMAEIVRLLEELKEGREDQQRQLNGLTAQLVELEQQQEAHRRRALQQEQRRRYVGLVERMDETRQRCETAQTLVAALAQIEAQLSKVSLSQKIYDEALKLNREIERLGIELEAQSATLNVSYLPDRTGTFLIDGIELADNAAIAIDQAVVVDVGGVGQLRIAPGLRDEIGKLRGQFDDKQMYLRTLLARHGFETIEELELGWREKGQLEVERSHRANNLKQVAPDGVERLAQIVQQLERQVEEDKPEFDDLEPGANEIEADLTKRIEQTSDALKLLQSNIVRREEREKQLLSEQQELAKLTAEDVVEGFSNAEWREKRSNELQTAVREAQERVNLVVRQEHALLDGAPSREEIEQSVRKHQVIDQTVREREDRQAALKEEARILEGALRRDAEDGLGVQVVEAEEQLRAAEAKVDELLLDVAALDLLEQELAVIADDRQRLITQPVVNRVERIAGPLFGEAAFAFGDALELESIDRQGVAEPIDVVSDGTREQIGVLARLAFADLLAEGGYPLPLVLDDPFVYSDDMRLDRLFEILERRAEAHQLLVLTCHARAFAPLVGEHGAHDVHITTDAG